MSINNNSFIYTFWRKHTVGAYITKFCIHTKTWYKRGD